LLQNKEIKMTINRYRYFYDCAFSMFGDHLLAFIDGMVELNRASSTIKLYLSCINDVAKAMEAAGMAACDQAWRHEENLWLWPYPATDASTSQRPPIC
jgi:integrase/recombinase XerD